MELGVNYPWLHCGWDFGPVPRGYGARADAGPVVAHDLKLLVQAGVRLLRWFVLADGMGYGIDEAAPVRRSRGFSPCAQPSLDPTFLRDFAQLLSACRAAGVRLLPVFLDFHWAFRGLSHTSRDLVTLAQWGMLSDFSRHPADVLRSARARAARLPVGYVKGGRADTIRGKHAREALFMSALVPLLEVSREFRDVIYAWELINEPEWITHGALSTVPHFFGHGVEQRQMRAFLVEGLERINAHGFDSTVGFAHGRTLARWDLPTTLHQVHYYPRSGRSRLPAPHPSKPSVLGELASDVSRTHAWPELADRAQELPERVKYAQRAGYVAALPWSYRALDRATEPSRALLLRALRDAARAVDSTEPQ